MLRFTLNLPNADKLAIAFGELAAQIKDWRDAWGELRGELRQLVARRFASAGASGREGTWKPLAARGEQGPSGPYRSDYGKRKRARYPGAGILTASGALKESLLDRGADHFTQGRALSLRWGTRRPYAAFLQNGTRKMFARPLLDFAGSSERQTIRDALAAELVAKFRRLGYALLKAPQGRGTTPPAGLRFPARLETRPLSEGM